MLISLVVVLGSFHRVERVLLVISATLALYIVDWLAGRAGLGRGLAPLGDPAHADERGGMDRHRRCAGNDAGTVGAGVHPVLRGG